MAARGSAAPQLLGAGGAPSPGSPCGRSALAPPQRAACEVCAPSVLLGIRACMASFQVPPSPRRFRKSSTFCWYVPVAQGSQPRRCPRSPCGPVGLLAAGLAPLPRCSITAVGSAGWHSWQVTFRMLLWVTGGVGIVKSTGERRLNILLLL